MKCRKNKNQSILNDIINNLTVIDLCLIIIKHVNEYIKSLQSKISTMKLLKNIVQSFSVKTRNEYNL